MNKFGKKSLALLLCAALGASVLTGCGKKADAAPIFTYNGEAVDNKTVTLFFRLQQAAFDESYGPMFAQYYGGANIWDMDLTGQGETYGETFKTQFKDQVEKLYVASDHAGEVGVELTDDDKKAIEEAADKFIADNDQKTLEAMSADKDTVVNLLQLQTIQAKVEDKVGETADTEVSDEEAAQKTLSYICYTPTTETEAESGTESEAAGTEASEASSEAASTEAETPVASESETAVETEKSGKTKSADKETEAASEAAAAGASTEASTEAAETEAETETESAEMKAARKKFKAMAEDKLSEIKESGKDFSEYVDEITNDSPVGVTASTLSYGEGDDYPAAELQDAVKDLDDDTLVDHIVEADGNYYILHLDKAFDEEATEDKKKEIIEERKQTAIDDKYTEWEKDAKFETNDEAFGELKFDRAYVAPEDDSAQETTEAAGTEAEAAGGLR